MAGLNPTARKGADGGLSILERSARWTLCYLAGMVVLWAAGFEAIYEHPTPFYALFRPLWSSLALPAFMGVLAVAGYVVGRRFLTGRWVTEWWAVPGGVFVALLAVSLRAGSTPAFYDWLANAGVGVLASGGLIAAGRAAQLTGFPRISPSSFWTRRYLAGLMVFAAVFAVGVALLRGPEAISAPYERHAYEFAGDVGKGGSIGGLFSDYNRMHPYLSMHSKVHPPGAVALFWVLSWLVGSAAPLNLALATVVAAQLALIPLFFWAKDLTDERTALAACTLYAFVPSVVLFTATSADALFPPLTLATLFLFGRGLWRGHGGYAAAAGAGYALMSLMKFTLLGLGVYFAFMGLRACLQPGGMRRTALTAAVMIAAFLTVHGAVSWATGFDYIECFRLAKAQFDTDQAALNELTPRYQASWFRLLNPLCWLYFAGTPVTLLLLDRLRTPSGTLRGLWWVLGLTLLALSLLYLGRGEGERSALYVFPFMVLPAAHMLAAVCQKQESAAPLGAAVAFLMFQSWLTESLFYTYW